MSLFVSNSLDPREQTVNAGNTRLATAPFRLSAPRLPVGPLTGHAYSAGAMGLAGD